MIFNNEGFGDGLYECGLAASEIAVETNNSGVGTRTFQKFFNKLRGKTLCVLYAFTKKFHPV